MKPVVAFDNFPSFGNAGARTAPGEAKYAAGFFPADTFPAEWANYFFHGATKGISDLNSATRSIWLELQNVLTNYNITPSADPTQSSQILEALTKLKAEAALAAHPVGSLYWTSSTENPATTFGGGTWVQIKDKFILAAGDTYSNGATGGSATVTLTTSQIPSNNHSFTPSGTIANETAGGTNSITTNPTFTGTAVTSGANKRGHTHTIGHGHSITTANAYVHTNSGSGGGPAIDWTNYGGNSWQSGRLDIAVGDYSGSSGDESQNHTHSVTASGTISGGAYKFSGTAHNHTFTGTAGTTGNKGDGTAHENMPPYIVKYCWERTA